MWLFFERIIKLLISLFATAYMARTLGTEGYGALSYVHGLVLMVSSIANVGMDSLLIREVEKNPSSEIYIVRNSFILKFSFLMLGALGLWVYLSQTGSLAELQILPIFIIVLFLSIFQIIEFYFLSKSLSKYSVWAWLLGSMISNVLKIIGLRLGFGLVFLSWCFLIESLIVGLVLFGFYRKQSLISLTKPEPSWWHHYIKSAMPLALASISVILYMRIDQVMIREMMGVSFVGLYAAAIKLSEFTYFIPIALTASYMPKWSSLKKNSDEMFSSVEKVTSLLILLSLSISVIGLLLGDYIILGIFGDGYRESSLTLKIHLLSSSFVFLGVVTTKVLILGGLEKLVLKRSIIGSGLNVVLNLFFIPMWGLEGAAFATLISQAYLGLFSLVFFKESRRIFFRFSEFLITGRFLKTFLNV